MGLKKYIGFLSITPFSKIQTKLGGEWYNKKDIDDVLVLLKQKSYTTCWDEIISLEKFLEKGYDMPNDNEIFYKKSDVVEVLK